MANNITKKMSSENTRNTFQTTDRSAVEPDNTDSALDRLKENVKEQTENIRDGTKDAWNTVKKDAFLAYDKASRALKPEDQKTVGEKATDFAHEAVDNARLVGLQTYYKMQEVGDNIKNDIDSADRKARAKANTHTVANNNTDLTADAATDPSAY